MKNTQVFVVHIDWQHCASWDEGASEVVAVCTSEAIAKREQQHAIDRYSSGEFNYRPYWNPKTEEEHEDWDFDVRIAEEELITV